MPSSLALYRAAHTAARALLPLAAHLSPKLAFGIEARAQSARDFAVWGHTHRDRSRPLVLFHAASAGELRQCEPVIRRLRDWHPEWQIAVTTFSPSGRGVARALPVDVTGLLPWDVESQVAPMLDALAPTAIIFGRADLWPVLALLAERRGIPLGLIAGQVRARSGRLRWPARLALAPAYAALRVAGAVAPEDGVRLATLGARPDRITITGDPRCDAVLERIAGGPAPLTGAATLVAGSTWPADERVVLEAFARVRSRHADARLLLVPHEPGPETLPRIRAHARRLHLPDPGSTHDGGRDSLRVLDEVGLLAWRYGEGVVAYVGGGFGGAGLHSVLEPAAWGIPVIVGPRHRDNADAARLAAVGALVRLPAWRASVELTNRWLDWLEEPVRRRAAGMAARAVVEAGAGAADCTAALVEALL